MRIAWYVKVDSTDFASMSTVDDEEVVVVSNKRKEETHEECPAKEEVCKDSLHAQWQAHLKRRQKIVDRLRRSNDDVEMRVEQ